MDRSTSFFFTTMTVISILCCGASLVIIASIDNKEYFQHAIYLLTISLFMQVILAVEIRNISRS